MPIHELAALGAAIDQASRSVAGRGVLFGLE